MLPHEDLRQIFLSQSQLFLASVVGSLLRSSSLRLYAGRGMLMPGGDRVQW